MARINFDDELDADPRFKRLVRKLGDEEKAHGRMLRFWRVAQRHWGNECALVPFEEFEGEDFGVILEVGLAEKRKTGIYAKGSEERFGWYLQICRASRKGVEARKALAQEPAGQPRGRPRGQPEEPRRSTGVVAPVNPPVPAPVPALSLVPDKKQKQELSEGSDSPQAARASPVADFIATYVKAYQARYRARPAITGKVAGQAKTLITSVGAARAKELVQVYCQMSDEWFLKKSHDFTTFMENLNLVQRAFETGLDPTGKRKTDYNTLLGGSAC